MKRMLPRHSVRPAFLFVALALFAGPLVQRVQAGSDLNVGDLIHFYDREGSTGGGEFGVAKLGSSTELFRTFCVQVAEYMDFDSTGGFKVAGISDHTVLGNVPLAPETAFLYTMFRTGTLPGTRAGSGFYDYTPSSSNHINDANDLQKAIWYLQGQSGGANNYYVAFAKDATDADLTKSANNPFYDTNSWVGMGIGNVRIANLLWNHNSGNYHVGDNAQDQLVLVPTPDASLAGFGLLSGLACAGVIRRRRSDLN